MILFFSSLPSQFRGLRLQTVEWNVVQNTIYKAKKLKEKVECFRLIKSSPFLP